MTVLARQREQVFTCPHCGSEWEPDEIADYTVSAAREYCQSCVDALDTNARREKWFEEQDGDYPKLAMYYLTNSTNGKLVSSVDAAGLVKWARRADRDGFHDALFDYIHSDGNRRADYRLWLLETH